MRIKNNLLVLGSLSANEVDRDSTRDLIKPLAIVSKDVEIIHIGYFDTWGHLGLSACAWKKETAHVLYIATENTLYRLNLVSQVVERVNIPNLVDLHEIDVIDNQLWLSNTGKDEVICYDLDTHLVRKANVLRLEELFHKHAVRTKNANIERPEKYHCNQIFKGLDGALYCLVHHINGRQFFRSVASRVLKTHGNGGVIRLPDLKRIPLRCHAPHSVTVVDGDYWLFNSGQLQIQIWTENWELKESIDMSSWGRGGCVSDDGSEFYAGSSVFRRRYASMFSGKDAFNGIEVFDTRELKSLAKIVIPDIEQVNNVYTITDEQANYLARFG